VTELKRKKIFSERRKSGNLAMDIDEAANIPAKTHMFRSVSAPADGFNKSSRRHSIGRRIFANGLGVVLRRSSDADGVEKKKSEKRQVVIMRGLPGSGKSHRAKSIAATSRNGVVCSADDYFVDSATGVYTFNFRKLSDAHNQCMHKFLDALLGQKSPVVVDNTNTRLWEYSQYVKIAKLSGYELKVVEIACPNGEVAAFCARRNSHGVPVEKVINMWKRFEKDQCAIVQNPWGVSEDLLRGHRRSNRGRSGETSRWRVAS